MRSVRRMKDVNASALLGVRSGLLVPFISMPISDTYAETECERT